MAEPQNQPHRPTAQPALEALLVAVVEQIADRVLAALPATTAQAVEPWMSVKQCARHLATSENALRQRLKRREPIPHARDKTGRPLFKASELDAYVRGGGAS